MRTCQACRRHIREEVCPFCGGSAVDRATPVHRVGRVFFAIGASVSISSYACAAYGAPAPPDGPYGGKRDTGVDAADADPDAPLFDVK
jgi:hypothetical protein